MNIKYSIAITGCTSWCGLGFYRGIKSYKYTLDNDAYKKNKKYFYIDSITYGFYGLILYMNPPMLPFTIYKELYRLEVNVRKLEDEKKSEYYNNIIS